jgi:hypothetical protein
MRTFAAFACLLALTTGCVTYQASKYTAATGAVAIVAGIVVGALEPSTGETDGHLVSSHEAAATVLILLGAMTAIGGVIGMVAHGNPTPAPPPRAQ